MARDFEEKPVELEHATLLKEYAMAKYTPMT
jgi:hypothetical protein